MSTATTMKNISNMTAAVRIGGKGSVRRKVKRSGNTNAFDEKRLSVALQKIGISSVPAIEEATLRSTSGDVSILRDAKVSASVQGNTCIIQTTNVITQEKPNTEEGKVEEVVAEKETIEEGEEATEEEVAADEVADKHKQSKGEKKARKVLTGLGMKPAPGFGEMRVRNSKGLMLVVKNPDVLKVTSRGTITWAIFGKIEMEDMNMREAQARQLMDQLKAKAAAAEGEDEDDEDEDCPDLEDVSFDDEPLGDLSEDDVSLVMNQAGVNKNKAIKALKQNDNDVVNAIMALSA